MIRPSHGDLIQKIQELKAKEMSLKKRAEQAEQMLNDLATLAELGERPNDALLANARAHVRAYHKEWVT